MRTGEMAQWVRKPAMKTKGSELKSPAQKFKKMFIELGMALCACNSRESKVDPRTLVARQPSQV